RGTCVGCAPPRRGGGGTTNLPLPADREGCLVILTGTVDVAVGGHDWKSLGGRQSVFEDRSTHAIYAPPSSVYKVTAQSDAELAVASAPASGRLDVRLIEPGSMK